MKIIIKRPATPNPQPRPHSAARPRRTAQKGKGGMTMKHLNDDTMNPRIQPLPRVIQNILVERELIRQTNPAHVAPELRFMTRDYPDAPPAPHRIIVTDSGDVLVDGVKVENPEFWIAECVRYHKNGGSQ